MQFAILGELSYFARGQNSLKAGIADWISLPRTVKGFIEIMGKWTLKFGTLSALLGRRVICVAKLRDSESLGSRVFLKLKPKIAVSFLLLPYFIEISF